ncbi:hypothetical protein JOD45_001512 [Scopulibacillus daqui]|uniref:Spore germination protein GerPA/GerPF n=1 Tax=Scopulibacillus daqui TaxID=1469162 RepID=A0ABS2PZ21_9BACL|nr:hypothetical protein [Scopulibacillus daqui]MBM7645301.1 hypothetical protein [Scopulibacillus daqui]
MAVNFSFGSINVNSQARNSTVSVGESNMPGWTYYGKSAYGNGFFIGISNTQFVSGNVNDMDGIDNPISTATNDPSVQGQGL